MSDRRATTARRSDCPDTVNGWHNEPDRAGRCSWCGRKISGKLPRPAVFYGTTDNLMATYRRFYDPNWGGGQWDADPAW